MVPVYNPNAQATEAKYCFEFEAGLSCIEYQQDYGVKLTAFLSHPHKLAK